MELRPYQVKAYNEVRGAWARGQRRVLVVGPTGAGKGTLEAAMCADVARAGESVLFLVHRREIVEDVAGRIQDSYARVGLILPGYARDQGARVQVASIQSLLGSAVRAYDVLVVDEAHHFGAAEWGAALASIRAERVVGFTATPKRIDGVPLTQHFDTLVQMTSYRELLELGKIVPCAILRPSAPTGMDLAQDPVDAYLAHARGSSCFLFTPRVELAKRYRSRLRAAGIDAEVISDATPHGKRKATVDGLKSGAVTVVVNAYTMTEGVDVPRVSTVVLARNCAHETPYVQMTGRALREYPGKQSALLIDLHGVSHLLGSPTLDRDHSLQSAQRGAGESTEREYVAPSESQVLGLDLVAAGDVPPVVHVASRPEAGATAIRSKTQYWEDLMRDVDAGVLAMNEATKAYQLRHGRSRARA